MAPAITSRPSTTRTIRRRGVIGDFRLCAAARRRRRHRKVDERRDQDQYRHQGNVQHLEHSAEALDVLIEAVSNLAQLSADADLLVLEASEFLFLLRV